jgi:hypothetical protein
VFEQKNQLADVIRMTEKYDKIKEIGGSLFHAIGTGCKDLT